MPHHPVDNAERAAILAAVQAGESISAAARRFGRDKGTVSRLCAAAGVIPQRCALEKADQARRDYAAAERLALLNEGFEAARAMLAGLTGPHQLQAWTIAVGILIDKRRLEDGEATSRDDVVTSGARERIAGRLDELAARRDPARAAG